jgi:hypothetical protein
LGHTWGDKAVVVDGWLGQSMNKDQAWTNEYIRDQGGRRMADKTASRPGIEGWDTEAPLWTVDENNKDSLTKNPGSQKWLLRSDSGLRDGDGAATGRPAMLARHRLDEVCIRTGLRCRLLSCVAAAGAVCRPA